MPATAASLSEIEHRRRAKRARVYYVARLGALGVECNVKLLDLSPFGAMVESNLSLATGDKVEFIRGDLRIPARVIWTSNDRAGLEFVAPAYDLTLR